MEQFIEPLVKIIDVHLWLIWYERIWSSSILFRGPNWRKTCNLGVVANINSQTKNYSDTRYNFLYFLLVGAGHYTQFM